MNDPKSKSLEAILESYQQSFSAKVFGEESSEEDDLMLVFGLTQGMKAENKQYWGRELGMCWERLVKELCEQKCQNFYLGIREGDDEICDLVIGDNAINTNTNFKNKSYSRDTAMPCPYCKICSIIF